MSLFFMSLRSLKTIAALSLLALPALLAAQTSSAEEERLQRLMAETAQLYVPITFNIGPPGQPAPDAPFLMNQTLVKTNTGWRIANILPIPLPAPTIAPPK